MNQALYDTVDVPRNYAVYPGWYVSHKGYAMQVIQNLGPGLWSCQWALCNTPFIATELHIQKHFRRGA